MTHRDELADMSSETDGLGADSPFSSFVRTVVSVRNFLMLAAGTVAGASLVVLGKEVVIVPVLGATPGTLVGALGLAVAFVVSHQSSCCSNCETKECGCSGECGDSCSYDL